MNNTNNAKVIGIADPFALNGVRAQMFIANYIQKNNNLIVFRGPLAH